MNYAKLLRVMRFLPVVAVALAMAACGNNPPKQAESTGNGSVGKITAGNTAHCNRK